MAPRTALQLADWQIQRPIEPLLLHWPHGFDLHADQPIFAREERHLEPCY